jgi:hypothetical protein
MRIDETFSGGLILVDGRRGLMRVDETFSSGLMRARVDKPEPQCN